VRAPAGRDAARREDPPPAVVRVDPDDGRVGVFCDAPVVLHVSQPLDESSLAAATFSVRDPAGAVPGELRVVGRGDVLVWRAARPLRPDAPHFVVVSGLCDRRGRELPRHLSRFVPCAFTSAQWDQLTP
jgi:hypothetical protein